MIPIKNFIYDTLRKMDKIKVNNCIELKTFKRDRGVTIEKTEEAFNVYEYGFNDQTYFDLSKSEVEKLLRVIKTREFPRSNMVRIAVLNRLK